ncbi:MAG: DUF5060 domain-containing protein [Spirochaetales bacterium]|nr:DUF5060 domain-containing protein [Spirochaetales bacterium]
MSISNISHCLWTLGYIFLIIYLACNLYGFSQISYNTDIIIESRYFLNSGVETFEAANSIVSPSIVSNPVTIKGRSNITYKAGHSIKLKPGFKVVNLSSGFTYLDGWDAPPTHVTGNFHAYLDGEILEVALITPENINKEVGKYEKLEIGIKLPDDIREQVNNFFSTNYQNGLNPFNPDDIKIEAKFISPTGEEHIRYGFYYNDFVINTNSIDQTNTEYNWRLRLAPDEIGNWSFSFKIIANGFNIINKTGFYFTCINSNHKGPVELGNNKYLRYKESNKMFFMIGENQAWCRENNPIIIERYANQSP